MDQAQNDSQICIVTHDSYVAKLRFSLRVTLSHCALLLLVTRALPMSAEVEQSCLALGGSPGAFWDLDGAVCG